MSAKGNCYDNATMESFFGVLKREELDRWEMPDLAAVRSRVFDYIETYYNRCRIHTALGMSPAAFESTTGSKTPSAEFSEASIAPQVGHEKAGKLTPRPRPVVAISKYPSAGCSPAEPASVSLDNQLNQQTNVENNNKKEYTLLVSPNTVRKSGEAHNAAAKSITFFSLSTPLRKKCSFDIYTICAVLMSPQHLSTTIWSAESFGSP